MERGRIAKPKETGEEAPSEYYLAGDLWVGGHVEFNSHHFVLIDCDEYALRYMEVNPSQVHTQSLTLLQTVHTPPPIIAVPSC